VLQVCLHLELSSQPELQVTHETVVRSSRVPATATETQDTPHVTQWCSCKVLD